MNNEALRLADALHDSDAIYPRWQAANELRRLHEVNQELLSLLIRYRHETPLGNQPYMIAIEADAAIAKATGESND